MFVIYLNFLTNKGFAGIALKIMEELNDEYAVPLFTLSISDSVAETTKKSQFNEALSFCYLSELSNCFVPLYTSQVSNFTQV